MFFALECFMKFLSFVFSLDMDRQAFFRSYWVLEITLNYTKLLEFKKSWTVLTYSEYTKFVKALYCSLTLNNYFKKFKVVIRKRQEFLKASWFFVKTLKLAELSWYKKKQSWLFLSVLCVLKPCTRDVKMLKVTMVIQ